MEGYGGGGARRAHGLRRLHRREHIGQAEQRAATPAQETLGQGLQACTAAPTGSGTPAAGTLRSLPRLPGAGLRRGRGQRRARLSESRTGEFRAAACLTLLGPAGRTAQGRAPGSRPPASGVKSYGYRGDAVCCAGAAAAELVSAYAGGPSAQGACAGSALARLWHLQIISGIN